MMNTSLHSKSSHGHAKRATISKDLVMGSSLHSRSTHTKTKRPTAAAGKDKMSMSLHSGSKPHQHGKTPRRGSLTGGLSKDTSQRALSLSTKVKSIRGLMNPYQLGESSHNDHQRRASLAEEDEVDIGTDIDDSEMDVNVDDDESSFADDTDDVDYLLGRTSDEDDEEEEEFSHQSPNSVVLDKPKSNSSNMSAKRRGRSSRKSSSKKGEGGRPSTRSPTDNSRSKGHKKKEQGRRLHSRNSKRHLPVVSDSGEDSDDSLPNLGPAKEAPKVEEPQDSPTKKQSIKPNKPQSSSPEKRSSKKEVLLRKLTDESLASRASQQSSEEKKSKRSSMSKGSNHSTKSGTKLASGSNHSKSSHSKSQRASKSSAKQESNATQQPGDKSKEEEDSVGIPKGSTASRREAVSKQHSKYVNQKPCKVGPIRRQASRQARARRATIQEVPPPTEGPMVGHGHSFSGSISSLTISTGVASKDDFSLPSPGVFSQKMTFTQGMAVSPHARRTAGLSRWQALPKGSSSNSTSSPDAIPTPPSHDLSSLASPVSNGNPGIVSRKLALPPSSAHQSPSLHCTTSQTTPSSISKLSGSSDFSNSMQSFALEDIQEQEIPVPQTPSQMEVGGDVSNTPAGVVSALTTPGCFHPSPSSSSLQSKLKQLSEGNNPLAIDMLAAETDAGTRGSGYLGDVMTTPRKPMGGRSLQSKLDQVAPATPSFSIGGPHGNELDTPGGVVSELTIGSSLMSDNSSSYVDHRQRLGNWMTNVQSVMLHESDYQRDSIPKMVRRHSLDSVVSSSHVVEGPEAGDELLPASSSQTQESDFAPRAPARQLSLASILL